MRSLRRFAGPVLVALYLAIFAGWPGSVRAFGELSPGGGATVTADWLNLRGGPGTANPVVSQLAIGTVVQLIAGPIEGEWWRVTDGQSVGYVSGAWLDPADAPGFAAVYDVDLNVPIHRQMTRVWCDPTDLQSWVELDSGQPLGDAIPVQQQFWDWELAHNAGFTVEQWDASPFAVASAAHQWLPDRGFNHFVYDDPNQATFTMAWLIANPAYREPSIANIWLGDHYILVRGFRATADPVANPTTARILGVYIMDPNQGRPSWLGRDRYIPIEAWTARYLTPVSYLTYGSGVPGDVWQGKYVTIQRDWSNQGPTLAGRVNATPASYGPG